MRMNYLVLEALRDISASPVYSAWSSLRPDSAYPWIGTSFLFRIIPDLVVASTANDITMARRGSS